MGSNKKEWLFKDLKHFQNQKEKRKYNFLYQKIILNVIELDTKFGSIIFPIFLIKTIKNNV